MRKRGLLIAERLVDQDLARRLGALAAAGRDSDSYPQAEQKLKLWQNRCRYHKTGRIPETEEQLQKTRALLEEAEDLRRQRLLLIARLEQQRKQLKTMERQQRRTREQREQQLCVQLEQAHEEAEQWAARIATLPSEQDLRQMQVRLGQLMPETGVEPACPPALQGLTAEQIWPKAQRDLAEHDRLAALEPKKEAPFLFFGLAALVFSATAVWLQLWWLILLLLGVCGFCCVRWMQQRRYNRQDPRQ